MTFMNRRRSTIFYGTLCCLAVFLMTRTTPFWNNKWYRLEVKYLVTKEESFKRTHLFENQCRFAWVETEDPSIKKYVVHPTEATCPRTTIDILEQYEDGSFSWLHKKLAENCSVIKIEGSLRPRHRTYIIKKTQVISKNLKRFWINADNYIITCKSAIRVVFQRPYMGVENRSLSDLIILGKPPFIKPLEYNFNKLSINILVLDSVSRTQFQRHMVKTNKLMNELGFITLQGYNKIGDNSCINLLALLAKQVQEAKIYENHEDNGDVDIRSILPFNASIDPDKIDFIWKNLKDATTMFNDEIGNTGRGVFHYPSKYFKAGFTKSPTDHYYRPYYVFLNKKLGDKWRLCLDNRILAVDFLDPWYQFAMKMAHKKHFGFTFVTTITHDNPNNLEHLDNPLHSRLSKLRNQRAMENSIFIIMGDHGNRIHKSRTTFAGRIEERQPLMSIYMPEGFRKQFPKAFETLQDNAERITSNFDVYKTLLDISQNTINFEPDNLSRGQTLFEPIPTDRLCPSNNVVSNFCLCMEKQNQTDNDVQLKHSLIEKTIVDYLNMFPSCVDSTSLSCEELGDQYSTNIQVQAGIRNKKIDYSDLKINSPIVYAWQDCKLKLKNSLDTIHLNIQYRIGRKEDQYSIPHPPMISRTNTTICHEHKTLESFCNCHRLSNEYY